MAKSKGPKRSCCYPIIRHKMGEITCNKCVCSYGFTIIEWLVSFFVTIILITLVFQFSAQLYTRIVTNARYNSVCLESYLALEHMAKHIALAPCEKKYWGITSNKEIAWRNAQGHTVGYLWDDNSIYFVTKKYNNTKKRVRARKNLLAKQVQSFTFTPLYYPQSFGGLAKLYAIRCNIVCISKEKTSTFSRVIYLKNRVIKSNKKPRGFA